MSSIIQRLARLETSADKEEFVRGLTGGSEEKSVKRMFLVGIVSGVLLSARKFK